MHGLLHGGPLAHQHIRVDDPPPTVLNVEAIATDDDRLEPIPLSDEYPETRFESHSYRLVGVDRLSSPMALYVHAPEMAKAA
jgi:hypothetical protein